MIEVLSALRGPGTKVSSKLSSYTPRCIPLEIATGESEISSVRLASRHRVHAAAVFLNCLGEGSIFFGNNASCSMHACAYGQAGPQSPIKAAVRVILLDSRRHNNAVPLVACIAHDK